MGFLGGRCPRLGAVVCCGSCVFLEPGCSPFHATAHPPCGVALTAVTLQQGAGKAGVYSTHGCTRASRTTRSVFHGWTPPLGLSEASAQRLLQSLLPTGAESSRLLPLHTTVRDQARYVTCPTAAADVPRAHGGAASA